MRIDKPGCGFKNCRYNFDGNCMRKAGDEGCEFKYYKDYFDKSESEQTKSNEYKNGYKKALEDINTEEYAITKEWNPSECPRCHHDFDEYEPCNDGQYKRAYALNRCPYCGQKIKWR